jgi:uncharacterized protein (DUF952 family)
MILHIVPRTEWDAAVARGSYAPSSLGAERFIHCSTVAQTPGTANTFFRGQSGLVVLCIDESRLRTELKYEAPVPARDENPASRFPHLYGPLNLDAVIRVIDFPCSADGTFVIPADLR